MKKVMLITIPRTGTRYFTKLMFEHNVKFKMFHTIFKNFKESLRLHQARPDIENWILVTTKREPWKVSRSWSVSKDLLPYDLKESYDLLAQVHALSPQIVSVDACDRDKLLKQFGDAVGISFKTDWKVVGATKELIEAIA